jgi:hypothetical protein
MTAEIRIGLVTIGLGTLVLAGACTGAIQDQAFVLYWEASRACEEKYRNLRVEQIDSNGDLTLSADLDVPANLGAFRQCYRDGIGDAILRRQERGESIPDGLNREPAVEME